MPSDGNIALVSLGVSIVGFILAWYTLHKGNKNSSAALLVSLNASFSLAWDNVRKTLYTPERLFYLGELLNLFEIACGITNEDSLTGISHRLMTRYICNCFAILKKLDLQNDFAQLLTNQNTYKEIRAFIASNENNQLFVATGFKLKT